MDKIVKKNIRIAFALCSLVLASCITNAPTNGSYNSKEKNENSRILVEQSNIKNIRPSTSFKNKEISLRDAAKEILIYHPRVKQVLGYENREAEMIKIAESAYYPQISGGLGMRRQNDLSGQYDKRYLQEMNVSINQVLYDFGKISSAVKRSKFAYLGSKIQTLMTSEDLINLVGLSVITVERFHKLSQLATEQVDSVKLLTKLVEKRQVEGASNLSDVYQSRSRLDDVLSAQLDILSQHQKALKNLSVVIGQPQITGASVKNLPDEFNLACSNEPKWTEIPSYQLAVVEAEIALAELAIARAEELPTIALNSHISRPLNATPRYGSRLEKTISVNVSVPIYQGGALSAGKRAAESLIESANARKAEVRIDIDQMLSELDATLQGLIERSQLLKARVNNLANTKKLYRQQYLELGTRTLVDLLNSEQEFHQAQVDVVNNHFDIIQTQLNCAYYQGKLGEYLKIFSK